MAGTIGKLRSKLPKVESMHPLSERDRAKKDYGKVESIKKMIYLRYEFVLHKKIGVK